MNKLRFLIIISLIFILITLTVIEQFTGSSPESTLVRAFANSGAEIVSSEITFTGSCIDKLKTSAEIETFYIGISEIMGANKPIKPEKVNDENFEGIELNNTNGMQCNYTLKMLKSKLKSDLDRYYVTLYVVDSSTTLRLTDIKSRVIGIFNEFNIKPGINTCLTGRYPGKLKSNEINKICTGIFKRTAAWKVNGIREDNLVSVSAYSRIMGDSVVVDGKNVNLNFAARYNSYEDKTYIWLATPLITTEY